MNDTESNLIRENLRQRMKDLYDGNSWVTDQVGIRVFATDVKLAYAKLPSYHHTVAQQLAHMIAWRNFVVQKLSGNDNFDIEDNTPEDWPQPGDWSNLREQFITCHNDLLHAIQNFDGAKWHSQVPLRSYSYLYLVNGIAEHDYYHFGQINALLAVLKKSEA